MKKIMFRVLIILHVKDYLTTLWNGVNSEYTLYTYRIIIKDQSTIYYNCIFM